jgi:hypothetical protein
MPSNIGIRLPDFLSSPYDDCASFQSRSTELVIFSPSAGEYVTIAWYSLSPQCDNLQSLIWISLGQHITADAFWPTESRNGSANMDYTGHAFAAWRSVVPDLLVLLRLWTDVFMRFVMITHRYAAFKVSQTLIIRRNVILNNIKLIWLKFVKLPCTSRSTGIYPFFVCPSIHFGLLLIFSSANGAPYMARLRNKDRKSVV